MIADSVSAELGIIKKEGSSTKLNPRMEPLAVKKALFSDASVTATLVFVHCPPCSLPQKTQNPLDPLDSHRSITNDNGLTLDTKDLPTHENHSPRSNSGSSSSDDAIKVISPRKVDDAIKVISPRKVSDTRKLFETDRGSKPQPTRWPTPKSVLKTQSNQTTGNISYTTKPEQPRALSTPPPSPPLTSSPLTMPSSNNPATGNVERIERDHEPKSNPPPDTSEPKRLDKDGTKETTETPARKRAALVCRRLPPLQQKELPTKRLGSPPGEVGTDHVSSQNYLTEDEPSTNATKPDANFFNSSDRNKPTFNPSQQNQNLWDLFGSPDEVKIYSALACGLACGAIATLSVPAAPVVAGIVGITAGAIVGYAIAEQFTKNMDGKAIRK